MSSGYRDTAKNKTESLNAAIKDPERENAIRLINVHDYTHGDMQAEQKMFRESSGIMTGFPNLDSKSTGLFPGLYVLGAVPSLGKTTFLHQIADQIAEKGTPVLFFSLEQSALELATKSLARIIYKTPQADNISALDIRRGPGLPAVDQAMAEYDRYSGNLNLAVSPFGISINMIVDTVRQYMDQTGRKPVVMIDYLQAIRQEASGKLSTREHVDMVIQQLKKLQVDRQLVVFTISSVNRQNYSSLFDYESFKESGGIEYTADVIWGLQLGIFRDERFTGAKSTDVKRSLMLQAKAEDPRRIELVCLKNRFGTSTFSCYFKYHPQYDYFYPAD